MKRRSFIYAVAAAFLGLSAIDVKASCTNNQDVVEIVLQADDPNPDALAKTKDIMVSRLHDIGQENLVQVRGLNQIVVDLPSPGDKMTHASGIIQQTGMFEIIDAQGQYLAVGTIVATTFGAPVDANPLNPVYTTIVTSYDLQSVDQSANQLDRPGIGFKLNESGANTFYQFTSANVGKTLSFVVDKTVISTATLRGAISSEGFINVSNSDDIDYFLTILRNGPFPAPVTTIESRMGSTLCTS